jgi:hypothetical protein
VFIRGRTYWVNCYSSTINITKNTEQHISLTYAYFGCCCHIPKSHITAVKHLLYCTRPSNSTTSGTERSSALSRQHNQTFCWVHLLSLHCMNTLRLAKYFYVYGTSIVFQTQEIQIWNRNFYETLLLDIHCISLVRRVTNQCCYSQYHWNKSLILWNILHAWDFLDYYWEQLYFIGILWQL